MLVFLSSRLFVVTPRRATSLRAYLKSLGALPRRERQRAALPRPLQQPLMLLPNFCRWPAFLPEEVSECV